MSKETYVLNEPALTGSEAPERLSATVEEVVELRAKFLLRFGRLPDIRKASSK